MLEEIYVRQNHGLVPSVFNSPHAYKESGDVKTTCGSLCEAASDMVHVKKGGQRHHLLFPGNPWS